MWATAKNENKLITLLTVNKIIFYSMRWSRSAYVGSEMCVSLMARFAIQFYIIRKVVSRTVGRCERMMGSFNLCAEWLRIVLASMGSWGGDRIGRVSTHAFINYYNELTPFSLVLFLFGHTFPLVFQLQMRKVFFFNWMWLNVWTLLRRMFEWKICQSTELREYPDPPAHAVPYANCYIRINLRSHMKTKWTHEEEREKTFFLLKRAR